MSEVNYRPVIDDMVWSYSRISSFYNCPYQWYLKYLCDVRDEGLFFSSYGEFIHSLLDGFYSGRKTALESECDYLSGFSCEVSRGAPSHTVFQRYFQDGLRYLSSLPPLPITDIRSEQTMDFRIAGLHFTSRIDVVGVGTDSGIWILDHKSRVLKPRSGRKKPTASDNELDDYLRQLYLYAVPVSERYHQLPSALLFNCFRGLRDKTGEPTGEYIIKETFDKDKFEQAKSWAVQSVKTIRETESFRPNVEFFKCKYLCGVHGQCEYYQMNFM